MRHESRRVTPVTNVESMIRTTGPNKTHLWKQPIPSRRNLVTLVKEWIGNRLQFTARTRLSVDLLILEDTVLGPKDRVMGLARISRNGRRYCKPLVVISSVVLIFIDFGCNPIPNQECCIKRTCVSVVLFTIVISHHALNPHIHSVAMFSRHPDTDSFIFTVQLPILTTSPSPRKTTHTRSNI